MSNKKKSPRGRKPKLNKLVSAGGLFVTPERYQHMLEVSKITGLTISQQAVRALEITDPITKDTTP